MKFLADMTSIYRSMMTSKTLMTMTAAIKSATKMMINNEARMTYYMTAMMIIAQMEIMSNESMWWVSSNDLQLQHSEGQ